MTDEPTGRSLPKYTLAEFQRLMRRPENTQAMWRAYYLALSGQAEDSGRNAVGIAVAESQSHKKD